MSCSSCAGPSCSAPTTCVGSPTSSVVNTLITPEPHYIPGYGGYLPQSRFRPGHTYGVTSHRVLLDPCVHMSPRSILNNIHPENCSDDFGRPGVGNDPYMQSQMALVNSRVNSFGRQIYQPNQTPGYTGFVPRFQTILGHTYSPACNRALARFEQDQWRDRLFNKELEALDGWRFCYKNKPWETPETIRPPNSDLQAFARNPCGGNPLSQLTIPAANASSPLASSCSACAGPCGCSNLRRESPNCDYGERRIWQIATDKLLNQPCGTSSWINPNKFCKPLEHSKTIYRGCDGMMPAYGGHVPGEIFRFGKTYGTSTRNSQRFLEKSIHAPLCLPVRMG